MFGYWNIARLPGSPQFLPLVPPEDPGMVPTHPFARRGVEQTPRPPAGLRGEHHPSLTLGSTPWKGRAQNLGRRFRWATVGYGGSEAQRFVSRWQSKGGRHLSCVRLTHKAQPVSDQKVTVLEGTSCFLPWLVSAPFATRDIPHPSADNSYRCFFTVSTTHTSSDVK